MKTAWPSFDISKQASVSKLTGFYGTHTKAAVSRFQKAQGWAGRGNVGRRTWSRLF